MRETQDRQIQDRLRSIPSVNEILEAQEVRGLIEQFGRQETIRTLRVAIDRYRQELLRDKGDADADQGEDALFGVIALLKRDLFSRLLYTLQPVINATGVVVHTNLGRSLLSSEAIAALASIGSSYTNLEIDLADGTRGKRGRRVEELLIDLTGAEDALIVNNNAAAVLLALDTFASGKGVIVSRGQLVEIGGSFRLPRIMAKGGAELIEVGTTNRTFIEDYEEAIAENTALLMRVHPSNYRIAGFTHEVPLDQLVALGRQRGVPVLDDLGSGVLVSLPQEVNDDLAYEPMVQDSVRQGADIVTFSGDKLLGGPQCGLIVGKAEMIGRMRRNNLMRAIRVSKLIYTSLQATLEAYVRGTAVEDLPTLRMLSQPQDALGQRAQAIANDLKGLVARGQLNIGVRAVESRVGGGALPTEGLPSWALQVTTTPGCFFSVDDLSTALRCHEQPVVARVADDAILFDLRAVRPEEDRLLIEAIAAVSASLEDSRRKDDQSCRTCW